MALRLVIAPRAERDLDEIFAFVAADNEAAAVQILRQIEQKTFRLLERPFMGPQVHFPKWPGLRKMTSAPYVIFYRPSDKEIEVIRVLHASRDLDTLLASS
jgi:toxin ParE1/3/4